MTFQFTTTQALKSFAGAAIFGLGMDAARLASGHLTNAVWFAVRELAGLLFWSTLSTAQAAHAQIFGQDLFLLDCPLQVLHALGAVAHWLVAAF